MDCLSSSCFFNWEKLPNEMKMKIIQKMDNNTRLSLRACSFNSQQLVESVPFRAIQSLTIHVFECGKTSIIITENTFSNEIVQNFDSFLEFRNKLEEELRMIDCIFKLVVYLEPTPHELNITKNGELLKVRELIFTNHTDIASDILSQVDPFYLKNLKLRENSDGDRILETQQVKQVPLLSAYGKHMTDEQLLSLNSSEIILNGVKDITAAGINQYIKKCLLKLENEPISFRINFLERRSDFESMFQGIQFRKLVWERRKWKYNVGRGVFRVNTNSKKFQFEICYHELQIKGIPIAMDQKIERNKTQNIRFEPTHQPTFKSLNYLVIGNGRLNFIEKYSAAVGYVFDSNDDLQRKLLKEISKIDYIKHLKIKDGKLGSTTCDYDLCPFKKPITVGRFSAERVEFDSNLLPQLEPLHLKEINITAENIIEGIFDMPQFIHAQKIDISRCNIQDQQLMNIHATHISIDTENIKTLTDHGINKFIKKMLNSLNRHDYYFRTSNSEDTRNISDCLEGLDFTLKRTDETTTWYYVNSPFSKFRLEIMKTNREIAAFRRSLPDM